MTSSAWFPSPRAARLPDVSPLPWSDTLSGDPVVISHTDNPFAESDADRCEIWTMLVERDIDAFLAADWSMVDSVFRREGFMGLRAQIRTARQLASRFPGPGSLPQRVAAAGESRADG